MDVILHCSESIFGNAALIDSWHRARGWSMIGYHYVILNGKLSATKYHKWFDGSIETGRPIDDDKDFEPDEIGSHTLGHNTCVGICLIGKSNSFTTKQIESVKLLLKMLKIQFGSIKVYQHSDFDPVNKSHCAGFSKTQMELFNKVM